MMVRKRRTLRGFMLGGLFSCEVRLKLIFWEQQVRDGIRSSTIRMKYWNIGWSARESSLAQAKELLGGPTVCKAWNHKLYWLILWCNLFQKWSMVWGEEHREQMVCELRNLKGRCKEKVSVGEGIIDGSQWGVEVITACWVNPGSRKWS